MQTQKTITMYATISNDAIKRTSKNGRDYTAFGIAVISDTDRQHFHYNVVAFGRPGHFAQRLQRGTRVRLSIQAYSQPDNDASIPLLTATYVQPVNPAA